MTNAAPMDPAEAFAQLGQIKVGETDLDAVLGTIAELARRTIPGAEEVSVTLVRNDKAATAAFTGDLARQLDESQYRMGYGPCLDAAAAASIISAPDVAAERRWPRWAGQAARHGIGSSLSIGLPVQEAVTGALNLYAMAPDAFDDDAVVIARTFAGYGAVALANAHRFDAATTLARQLQAAMDSRAVIEQAKGIIMGERGCVADEAFAILAKLSQDSNRKLRDVAVGLVQQANGPRS